MQQMLVRRLPPLVKTAVLPAFCAVLLLVQAGCSTVGTTTQGQSEPQEFPKIGELPRDKPDQLMTPAEKDAEIQRLLARKRAQQV